MDDSIKLFKDEQLPFHESIEKIYLLSTFLIIISFCSSIYAYIIYIPLKGLYNPNFVTHFTILLVINIVYIIILYFTWKKSNTLKDSSNIEESICAKNTKIMIVISLILAIPSAIGLTIVAIIIIMIFSLAGESSSYSNRSGVSPQRIYYGMKKLK